jgi:flagellar secretion chaperone FliS
MTWKKETGTTMPQQLKAYKAYSAATRTVAKTRQIVMLYDGAIRFIKQAQTAIEEKRIEDRFRLLVRASDVMVGLQNCIDFENGGEVAHTLHGFYTAMSMRILSVNLHPRDSMTLCDGIIQELKQMRDVWENIDRNSSASGNAAAVSNVIPTGNANPPGDNVTLSA